MKRRGRWVCFARGKVGGFGRVVAGLGGWDRMAHGFVLRILREGRRGELPWQHGTRGGGSCGGFVLQKCACGARWNCLEHRGGAGGGAGKMGKGKVEGSQ